MTDKRRTLSDADISSRRSTPRGLRVESLGVSGGDAAKSLRRVPSGARGPDGAPWPEGKGETPRPGGDRD